MDTGRRVEQLVGAAARLFARCGYHGTTVREIARSIDLQGGSLYAHIGGKEDLLWTICERAARQFHAAVSPVADSTVAPAEKLRAALRAHVGVVAADLPAATVYFHEWRFLGPDRQALIRERRDAYEALFRRIVAEGRRTGAFRAEDDAFPALLVLSAGNWLAQWFRPDGPLDPDAVAGRFADLILGGLSPAVPSAPTTNGRVAGPARPAVEVTA